MNKFLSVFLSLALAVCLCGAAFAEAAVQPAVIEISTAEELAAIADDLSGNYVLTADIDLNGAEWIPLGTFVQLGTEGEEAEMPNPDFAFSGTFDGQGHTISNFTIHQPQGWCIGLFGCIANADVGNFAVTGAETEGTVMVSAVVGYAFCSTVHDVTLDDATVTAYASEMSAEGMYGGIVGAGMGSLISDCVAKADIVIPDNTANTGIVGGGLEQTSVVNCTASGTVTAGSFCYGLGGVSGCGFGAEAFTNCVAKDVVITAGEGCFWIGGVTGYAGGYEDEAWGVPVTVFTGCSVDHVSFNVAEGTETGEIVCAGFYDDAVAEAYGAPFDAPSKYVIVE